MKKKPKISIIVPTFNEKDNLKKTPEVLKIILKQMVDKGKVSSASFILFVNDGSNDETFTILKDLNKKNKNIFSITLDKNYGHQIALIAGMDYSFTKSEAMITIDCDLQQDVNAIEKFIDSFNKGNQIVLGVRKNRINDSFFKLITANIYHKIITVIGIKYLKGHADYRLVCSKSYGEIQKFVWANQFLRSVFTGTSFKTDIQYHDVSDRLIGKTKYSFKKMILLALEGIFSNSLLTLKFLGFIGLGISILSILLIIYVIFTKLFLSPVEGWSSTVLIICFFGGIIVFTQTLLSEAILRLINQFFGNKPYGIKFEK